MQEGIESHIQRLDTWATEHQLNYVILDPITVGETSVPALRDRRASCCEFLLSATDQVYLSAGGYQDLTGAIMGLADQKEWSQTRMR